MVFGKYINKKYLKYLPFFLIGMVALVIIDSCHLVIPESLGKVVGTLDGLAKNEIIYDDGKARIINVAINVLIVAAILLVGRVIFRLSIFYASSHMEADFRKEMFEKAERLSVQYFQDNKVGAIMAWFTTDLECMEEQLGWGTVMLVDGLFLTVLTLIKMFQCDLPLTIITFIPVILIIIWGVFVEKYMSMKWKEREEAFDKLYDYSQENFTGIRVIKAFVKETMEIHKFAKIAKNNVNVNVNFARLSVLFNVFIEVIIALIIGIMFGFGGWFVYLVINGGGTATFLGMTTTMNAEKLVTFTGYFDVLVWPLIALGQIFTMTSRSRASYKRIANYLDTPEDVKSKPNAIELVDCKGTIEFKNFSFKYPSGSFDALKNINLVIESGDTIGVVGKIGSGKSCFVNSLLRLYNYNEGTLFIDGKDIMDLDIKSVRDNVSICPQDNFLFSDEVANNIAFSNKETPIEDVVEAAKFASVHNDIEQFKEGYKTISGERGVTLSGGQKQRISIARAFLKNAPILILDDSVSAVDTKTEETILRNIKEQRSGKTTILVASRVSTVQSLDKIIVFNNGVVEGYGKHEELLKISPTYQKMVFLQTLESEMEGGK